MRINQVIKSVTELFNNSNICQSHNINHVLRVKNHVSRAFECIDNNQYSMKMRDLAECAAILHDADDKKFYMIGDKFPNKFKNAQEIMLNANYDQDDIDLVIKMISYVSSSENGDNVPPDAQKNEYLLYPRFADRLEAGGFEGVKRCYQYTLSINRPLFTSDSLKPHSIYDVWIIATQERYNNYKGNSASMIDHYYDKLLRLNNFETTNEYFIKEKEKILSPLLLVIEQFIQNNLTHKYMQTFLE